MIKILILAGFLSVWAQSCTQTGDHSNKIASDRTAASQADTTATVSLNFNADIKPIFQAHCQPCHFEGGKMYERMPFDQAKTIQDHREGIFRRIKDPEEVKKLTTFLERKYP